MKLIYCTGISVIVLLPSLLGLLLYSVSAGSEIYVVQVNQSASSTEIFTRVIGSYDSAGFKPDFKHLLIENFSVVQLEDPDMRNNIRDTSSFVLYIDHNIEEKWRISSPKVAPRTGNNYSVTLRKVDFDLAPLDLSRQIGVTRSLEDLPSLTQLLTGCSDNSLIHIADTGDQRDGTQLQVDNKYLFDNGSVIEVKTLAWKCSLDGHPCNLAVDSESDEEHELGEIGIECRGGRTLSQVSFQNTGGGGGGGGGDLRERDTALLTGKISSHCCHNSSHIIRFYGDQCDNLQLGYLHKICKFSLYFDEGTCGFNGLQTRTQICRVYGLNCVLKRSFQVFCRTQLPLEGCLLDEFSCV